jgi:uracil-DNA glycosylase
MDPVKRAGVGARSETQLEEQVRDWLRYGEDLGLAPYYRDRPLLHAIAEAASLETRSVTTSSDISSAVPAAIPATVPTMMADAAPGRAPAATLLPATAPSLFEAIERIAGDTLPRIREDIGDCTRCKLHKARTKIVFGTGNPHADLMFVGEGPGRDEDLSGEPFVGRAGKLLTDMIKAMGLQREDVYIANVVKCRPPENRLPEKDEITTCSPFLMRQIDAIRPKVICTLGSCSAQTLLQTAQGISKLRGEWFDFRGVKLMPTYHPAYLLRNPAAKPEVWKDLQKVMAVLGLQPKKR